MRQPRRRARPGRRPLITVLAVAGPLAVLLPATVGGAASAVAAPSAGYTASLIPTGIEEFVVAVDPASSAVYLGAATGPLTVVDGTTNTVTTTIGLPGPSRGIAVDPVTDTIYVSVAQTTTSQPAVDVIDGATNTVTDTIPLPAGSAPAGVAVDSSTDRVYVAEEGTAAVAVIDGSSDMVTATLSTSGIGDPSQLAVDEASDVIWTGTANGFLVAINGASNTVGQPISLPLLQSLAVNPVSDTVYAATQSAGIDVIDGATGAISTTIGVTAPLFAVAVDPGSDTVFASSFDGSSGSGITWVINGTSNAIVDTIERGGVRIAADTATGAAYAAPFTAQPNAAWVLTPSATDAWSPVIKTAVATFTAGTAGSVAIKGTALPAATYSETGPLPSGVTLSAAGTMSGTPAAGTGGVYPITITASNGIPPDYSQAFTLTVDEAPALTAPAPATLRVGTSVSIPIAATGYPAPSVGASNLPAGLEVTAQGSGQWELTGTPAVGSGGVYDVDFHATNAVGTANSTVPITVQEGPSFTSAPATTFLTDSNNNYIASVDGYPAVTLTATGSIPAWLHLDTGGLLWGDPPATAVGVYHFTITASNSVGRATQAFTLNVTQPVAIGVEGSNGQLWALAPRLGLGWHTLGGKITAPPAVAARPNPNGASPVSPVFIATGTDKHLYIRSLSAGWEELGPSTASCLGAPAAVITGTPPGGPFTLTVACRGPDNALWENAATMPASGLPRFTSTWKSLGGVLSAGPAAAPVNGTTTFFVRSTSGRIYTRTLSAGYKAAPWSCIGQPAAASEAAAGIAFFACQGGDHALWEASYDNGTWFTQSMGGSLIGGSAVAATSLATYLIAEGTNHVVWDRIDSGGSWMSIGITAVGGVGAVALN